MQLSNFARSPTWYFIFGPAEKSSLAQQFATQHKLVHLHLKNSNETTFRDHINTGLVVQCTPVIFRQVQYLKPNIIVIILEGNLSAEEIEIQRDYQKIGRCISLKNANYKLLRKEVYPKLIVLFGPNKAQILYLCESYFNFSGYILIQETVTANDLVSKLSKQQNFILTGFVPQLSELNILEQFFNVHVVHLKHQRTELSAHEDYFRLQAKIIPEISKKSYFHSIDGSIPPFNMGSEIGQHLLPQLIFVNAKDDKQRKGVTDYILKSDGLLLNMNQIDQIYNKQQKPIKGGIQRIQELTSIIFKSINRKQIFLIDYPWAPQQFFLLKDKTRSITLFADCLKSQNYEYSNVMTPAINFLETHTRKHIELDFAFEKQIQKVTKYLIVNGPPCVGKTSAAKYISSSFGYKHIEYDSYVASIKEKLIAPEDGEELPFHKIAKHFNSLITSSGQNPILIDGLSIDWKDIDNWVALNGPPVVFNLKTDEKELIRRTRRKNEADVNAEVTEQQAQKTKELIAKNNDWADQLGARCPAATLYQIDFSPQVIKAEKLLDEILKPRVFLVQENRSLLFQNICLKHNLGYFDISQTSLKDIAVKIRQQSYRNVVLNNYNQQNQHLVCQDFHEIQKLVGSIRYLAIWNPETIEAHDEKLHLEAPPKPQKPKPAEGEEGGEAPPAEEQGEVKKKVLNIYDFVWTKLGNQKNISQWFFKLKKNVTRKYSTAEECYSNFQKTLKSLAESKDLTIYDSIVD